MSHPLRVAVIGTGYLGQFHAEKYAALPQADLVTIVDIDAQRAADIAKKTHCQGITDYTVLKDQVDAVSIVTPTSTHFEIGKFFLENGIHVLMEKPITETTGQAQTLIDLAHAKNLVLQVGFLERFNPIVTASAEKITAPLFIESTRIMPFNPRNKDVNVVLDLMIHDIDLIQSMVKQPIVKIDASGACVLTEKTDIANARIQFEGGCVASVTASRISLKSERKMRLFQRDGYFSLNFQDKVVSISEQGEGEMFPGIPNIKRKTVKGRKKDDALLAEIDAFLNSIATNTPPVVSGEDGKQALQTALEITQMVMQSPIYKAVTP